MSLHYSDILDTAYGHINEIKQKLDSLLDSKAGVKLHPLLDIDTITHLIVEDLAWFALHDPAADKKVARILCYSSFTAVLHYRLAHACWLLGECNGEFAKQLALEITSFAKSVSGAEIHPAADIGKRFVLDHGVNTVIGETTVIGDECYILGDVTIGAYGISNNPCGKRHPSLGDNVQVGAGARLLGPISIGDNSFIAPFSVVTESIPANSRISIVNQLQVTSYSNKIRRLRVSGLTVTENNIVLFGNRFIKPDLKLLDANFQVVADLYPVVVEKTSIFIKVKVTIPVISEVETVHLKIEDYGEEVVMLSPPDLLQCIRYYRGYKKQAISTPAICII
ncbi:serine O-acetyltransferase [Spartinivicinus ruber]|uniref:serine O-acetyltransferase n=1 Tax=Spartinivicinus ruber TaxID=2683272 RepID=UPI0013D1ED6E|nr:serine O-acetyltransferase [Spartinivicinus ruber]